MVMGNKGMSKTVSIIVPLYHGEKYIKSIINQAEANARNALYRIELLLVNDGPDAPIDEKLGSASVRIHVINTEQNRGIHGTRVRGLEYASGESILFLDQDDKVSPDYIEKQLAVLGDADVVVCQALQGGKKFYHGSRKLEECIRRDYMMQMGNFIISPGQALIRREAIPEFWKTNILKRNGADDWFLWLCMLCAGKQFVCNQEILFEHVVHTENTSANGFSMLGSMYEVYEKLKGNVDCSEVELNGIRRVIEKQGNNYIRERDKFLGFYFLLDDWMELREHCISVADYFLKRGIKKVAIYGKGRIGLRLAEELQSRQIVVSCFIDRDAEIMPEGIRTVRPDDLGPIQEPVIITVAKSDATSVSQLLRQKGAGQLYFLPDIIRYLKKYGISEFEADR